MSGFSSKVTLHIQPAIYMAIQTKSPLNPKCVQIGLISSVSQAGEVKQDLMLLWGGCLLPAASLLCLFNQQARCHCGPAHSRSPSSVAGLRWERTQQHHHHGRRKRENAGKEHRKKSQCRRRAVGEKWDNGTIFFLIFFIVLFSPSPVLPESPYQLDRVPPWETQMWSSLVFCAFYPFSLSAAGTKAPGPEHQRYLGLMPYEWARVKPGILNTDSE